MPIKIGEVEALFRYPVKSMGGERLEVANLGWHGLDGDRRLAFRRLDDRSGFPWLTATKLPDLLLFGPHRRGHGAEGDLPTHVRTPDGEEMPVFGEGLATEVGRRHGAPVQMMQLKHGIFDDASISVIASETVREIGRLAGQSADVRRFRPNVLVRLLQGVPFLEDKWVGGVLLFGDGDDAPAVAVTMRDVRCSMVNLDPDSASSTPEVLKAVVRANEHNAGIYGTVTRSGRLAVGQTIFFRAVTEPVGASDRYELTRFVQAQERTYEGAASEIRSGLKRSHWMWYIFPQFEGLGSSSTSRQYAIKSLAEAEAYLRHPVLGPRLLEIARTTIDVEGRSAVELFGSPDDMKLRSCATLFACISPAGSVFEQLLDKYFGGERDGKTLRLLGRRSA